VIDEHTSPRLPERAVRRDPVDFTDAAYIPWRVVERDSRRDPGRRGDTCLIFSSTDVVRRVWRFPATWRQLTDGELEALSWVT
jgi:hypothetical protein